MKDSNRRRVAGLTAGLFLLLLVSCNVARAVRGRSTEAGAGTALARQGTLPLVTALPGAAPTSVVAQPLPGARPATPATPARAATAGVSPAPTVATPVAPGIEPDIAAKTPAVTPPPENTAALSPAAPARAPNPRPNGFSTIEGNALRATGLGIRGVAVRLRDARFGRIVDTQTSGESGVFAFRSIDPGVYIVEVVGDDQHVLAASQLLNVTAGDTLSTSVRLPFRVAGAGLFDSKGMAAIVAAEAAAAGILTTTTTNPVSPTQ